MMIQVTPEDMQVALRLLIATVLGGLIGFEREIHGKGAGFRTNALVSVGSALIMITSIQIFEVYKATASVDPGRIAAQVVSGIGFLGAGAIIRNPEKIKGLTTAACIWVSSGVGLACGIGRFHTAVAATILALLILIVFSKVDRIVASRSKPKVP